jgi:uncharacterized protein (TIGR03437 family)
MVPKSFRQHLALPYVQRSVRIFKFSLMFLTLASFWTASAQSWDNTGDKLLNGTYYFRHVLWDVSTTNQDGSLGAAIAAYGQINFDGNGNYSVSAQLYDGSSGSAPSAYNVSGTYSIAASGYGFMDSPLLTYIGGSASGGDVVYGLVSNGIFIGNSTENQYGYNDLMIAAPLPSPAPTLSSLKGNYTLTMLDMPISASPYDARDAAITFTADGNGNMTNVQASGYVGVSGTSPVRNSLGTVKYLASGGAFNLQFPNFANDGSDLDTRLIGGNHYLYISPDGNFVFGGSPTGWDMIVGIRNGTGAPNFSGLYYQVGMDEDETNLSSGYGNTDNYFGSLKSLGNGNVLGHQRIISTALFTATATGVYDSTYAQGITINADGTADDGIQHYYFANGGAIRIGVGQASSGVLGISVALAGPTFTAPGSGPYIDPTSITNTASSALFTSSITAGELITFYGANLATGSAQDATFPTTLDGVQVKINGTLAPILSVNKCGPYPCATVMVPYEVAGKTVAQIQLFNKNVASNIVTAWVAILSDGTGGTAPGVFTIPAGGLGYAAAQHGDYTTITPQSPAQPGETIVAYLTGLGPVTPSVADGAPGPVPAATANATYTVYIDGTQATTVFVGLTPQAVGLAQINLTIPTGIPAGDHVLEVAGPDSDTFEALISIGSGSTATAAAARPAIRPAAARTRMLGTPRTGATPRRGGTSLAGSVTPGFHPLNGKKALQPARTIRTNQ